MPRPLLRLHIVGSYKPNLANFDYAIQHIKEDFGIEKDEILIVANSKYHDVQP
jgi:FMN phosphatase YigB (HAD superfamily)